jgi:hypothetical protein
MYKIIEKRQNIFVFDQTPQGNYTVITRIKYVKFLKFWIPLHSQQQIIASNKLLDYDINSYFRKGYYIENK